MPDKDVDLSAVRRWAKDNGIDVADKGAIAKDVVEKFKNRDRTPVRTTAPSTSDDTATPAGYTDAAGIKDEVTATVETEKPAERTEDSKTEDSKTDDAYNDAWRYATGFENDWSKSRALRNRVSIQTLENGFIHAQRATGTDEVQARLAERGFLRGVAHGVADEDTVQAYARYQDSIGLPGTGIPERTSLEALGFDVIE
jgi:hypothetical protein